MKTFKELSEEYAELLSEVKMKKLKKWKPNAEGNLEKVLVKQCQDAQGQKVPGFKVVDGKKCEKMSPAEIKDKAKVAKKVGKTKKKNQGKISRRAEKIRKKKEAKGLIAKPVPTEEEK